MLNRIILRSLRNRIVVLAAAEVEEIPPVSN
jgi:hypothetical protein